MQRNVLDPMFRAQIADMISSSQDQLNLDRRTLERLKSGEQHSFQGREDTTGKSIDLMVKRIEKAEAGLALLQSIDFKHMPENASE